MQTFIKRNLHLLALNFTVLGCKLKDKRGFGLQHKSPSLLVSFYFNVACVGEGMDNFGVLFRLSLGGILFLWMGFLY